jgi:hypothetical protein
MMDFGSSCSAIQRFGPGLSFNLATFLPEKGGLDKLLTGKSLAIATVANQLYDWRTGNQ